MMGQAAPNHFALEARDRRVVGLVTAATGLAALAALGWWLAAPPRIATSRREAADDAARREAEPEAVVIGALFQAIAEPEPSADGGSSWPRFRGPAGDNIVRGGPPPRAWPAGGPPMRWSVELGEGYAGPAIHAGRVYLLDYDHELEADMLRCFNLRDGQELWRRGYHVRVKRHHGMSRTVPAVTDRVVVTMGPRCHVMAAAADTGAFLWGRDLPREYGAEVPLWYTGQCPLIDDDVAVLAPAGTALMIGVEVHTGATLWETPNPHGWTMSHSSIVPMTLAGRRTYVYVARGGVAGVAADGPDRGALLWASDAWNRSVMAPSPVAIGPDRFVVTAGHGAGSMVFQVRREDGVYSAIPEQVWDRRVFACEQHTPLWYRGHLLTVMPKDAGEYREQLVCMRPDGTLAWNSGKTHRFGLGPFMLVNGRLLVMNDHGRLTLANASVDAFEPLAEAAVLDGRESWAPMAFADGMLLARDFTRMVCLDLR